MARRRKRSAHRKKSRAGRRIKVLRRRGRLSHKEIQALRRMAKRKKVEIVIRKKAKMIGKRSKRARALDKKKHAMPPGIRITPSGHVYEEKRANRAD